MKSFKLFLILVLFLGTASTSFAVIYQKIGFPYKVMVYCACDINKAEDRKTIKITRESPRVLEFEFNGKKYSAMLLAYGAIYVKIPGKNPKLLSFNVNRFKQRTFIGPRYQFE